MLAVIIYSTSCRHWLLLGPGSSCKCIFWCWRGFFKTDENLHSSWNFSMFGDVFIVHMYTCIFHKRIFHALIAHIFFVCIFYAPIVHIQFLHAYFTRLFCIFAYFTHLIGHFRKKVREIGHKNHIIFKASLSHLIRQILKCNFKLYFFRQLTVIIKLIIYQLFKKIQFEITFQDLSNKVTEWCFKNYMILISDFAHFFSRKWPILRAYFARFMCIFPYILSAYFTRFYCIFETFLRAWSSWP